jgi:hypothetical protein
MEGVSSFYGPRHTRCTAHRAWRQRDLRDLKIFRVLSQNDYTDRKLASEHPEDEAKEQLMNRKPVPRRPEDGA